MLGEYYRHYIHYISIFDIFDLSHIYKIQDSYYITAFELFFLRLQLPSSLWTMWCCRGTGSGTCGTLGYMECQPCLPQIQVNQPSCHHQDTTKRHQDTLRFAQICPVSPPWRTHLYPFVLYSTVQPKLKPVHLPHYQLYHQTTTTTNQTSLYQTTPCKVDEIPFIE